MEGVKLTVNKGLSNHFQVSFHGALNLPEVILAIPLRRHLHPPYLPSRAKLLGTRKDSDTVPG